MPTILDEQTGADGVVLTEVVRVRRRFLRSVNLKRDFYTDDPLDGYIKTPSALSALQRISTGIHKSYARAFTLTGPYGSGKSAFGMFAARVLATTLSGEPNLRKAACEQEPALTDLLFNEAEEGLWPILLTGTREPVASALWHGLLDALERLPDFEAKNVLAKVRAENGMLKDGEIPTASQVVKLYASTIAHARELGAGCRGLFVVVDEFGKFLEYAAFHPDHGDLQVLQELAEFATRSGDAALMLVTILHQSFDEYGARLSAQQRTEWQKVQGRFADIPFGDGPEETVHLIAHAIEVQEAASYSELLDDTTKQQMESCRDLKLFPPTISGSEFERILRETYPLHPLTLRVLPYVFRRYGQNERSLFSFLSSEEPFGFHEFLRSHHITRGCAPVLRLDHLYDYVVGTMGSAVYSNATSKLWGETEEALHRLRDADPLQSRLLKTIGFLHILGEQTHILPSKDVLVFALSDSGTSAEEVEAAIIALQSATLITYRQFKNAYRPYEGSDIDIDERLRDARSHYTQGTDGVRIASTLGVTQPIVARRHSYQTGTLRFFQIRYCRPEVLEQEIAHGHESGDGVLLLCLATSQAEMTSVRKRIGGMLSDRRDVIVGINVENDVLREAAVALQCLTWVQDNTPQLRNDRVAAREVRERLLEATAVFQTQWESLLRPQESVNNGNAWYYRGELKKVRSFRELQELVSDACGEAYHFAPILRNELINRRQLSSTATSARRDLMQAMIENRNKPRLGIEGYPPQASMYRSILESTGIHRSPDGGISWNLYAPDVKKVPELAHVWKEMEDFIFGGTAESKPLPPLIGRLRGQPYGLTEGVIPVLICAVLLCYEAEVAVYEDGIFAIDIDSAMFERMIKQPEHFHFQGCRIQGEREKVLNRFARGKTGEGGLLREGADVTLTNVMKALYRNFNNLHKYNTKTRRMGEDALAVRDLFGEGKEPDQLLFVELPRLLGATPFVANEADSENAELFFSRWNSALQEIFGAYDILLKGLEAKLCENFGAGDWEEIRVRATRVGAYVTETRLRSFVLRATKADSDRTSWLESVAAGVVGRAPSSWSDAETDHFTSSLPPLVSAFRNSEAVAFEKNRRMASDTDTGVRIAVTSDNGEEDTRIAIVREQDAALIKDKSKMIIKMLKAILDDCSEDVCIAALSHATQDFIHEKSNG